MTELAPTTRKQRKLSTFDLLLIWFAAAIGIPEIWAGGLPALTGLGLAGGLLAIVLGRTVGNTLLALTARIGAATGLPTMVLTRPTFGVRGSYLPALFNVVQLLGWTAWMVYVGALYLDTLGGALGLQPARALWAGGLGALCTLWAIAFAGQTWWKYIERVSVALLFLLTVAMTVVVLREWSPGPLTLTADALAVLAGMDLVIAMSVSWLPLVADYSRFALSKRAAERGTFWGYFIGGTWMYSVGLLVALATQTEAPDRLVIEVLAGQGTAWVVIGVALVVVSTATTTFLDIYSAAVSAQNLVPRLPSWSGALATGVIGTVIALALDPALYEPFLLAIGAVFLPAFTVVLTDYYVIARQRVSTTQMGRRGGSYWYSAGFNPRALAAWLIGFLVYDWARGMPSVLTAYNGAVRWLAASGVDTQAFNPALRPFEYGASLPCIVVTAAAYLLLVAMFGRGTERKRRP